MCRVPAEALPDYPMLDVVRAPPDRPRVGGVFQAEKQSAHTIAPAKSTLKKCGSLRLFANGRAADRFQNGSTQYFIGIAGSRVPARYVPANHSRREW
jgi:hypothetical protein